MQQGDSEGAQEAHKPKLWRWTSPHQYPVQNVNEDCWDMVLQTLLKKDNIQCKAWKDEVENLLIFAGLFSAVVTGFVVDSYKSLQLASAENTGPENPSLPPTPSSVRINAFWFSSLVLSITAVVVGIVGLQWIREHQRYTEPLTPKQALAVFHMRADGLKKWRIPQIFAGLPLLLQTAVVLFFLGLVDFLVSLNLTVAMPVIILVGATLLFLLLTSILPTIQTLLTPFAVWPCSSRLSWSQCPYKSPQAWAFKNCVILVFQVAGQMGKLLTILRQLSFWTHFPFHVSADNPSIGQSPHKATSSIIPIPACLDSRHNDWVDFDILWLTIRDSFFHLSRCSSIQQYDRFGSHPPYDLIRVLAYTAAEHSADEEITRASFQCYKQISLAIIDKEFENEEEELMTMTQMQNLQSCLLPSQNYISLSLSSREPDLWMMHDENMATFLGLPGIARYAEDPTHAFGKHLIELHTRLWLYSFYHRPDNPLDVVGVDSNHPLSVQLNYTKRAREIPEDILQAVLQQHYLLLDRIFEQSDALGSGDPAALISGYPMLEDFLSYAACFQPPKVLESSFASIFTSISRRFKFVLQDNTYDDANFLFFAARLYLEKLAQHPWFSEIMKFGGFKVRLSIIELLKDLISYENRLNKNRYIDLYNLWNSSLYPFGGSRSRGPTVSYIPISEQLLRFLPYTGRLESSRFLPIRASSYTFEDLMKVVGSGEPAGVEV